MDFFDVLQNAGRKLGERVDKQKADFVKRNSERISDDNLLQAYADDSNASPHTHDALRRELRRRGYDDLD